VCARAPPLANKLVDVRQKLENLQKLEHELQLALRSCDKELCKQDAHCPILQDGDAGKRKVVDQSRGFVRSGVPITSAAVKLVRDVLSSEGVAAEVREVLVTDLAMATDLAFSGSPTIRINGRDVAGESSQAEAFALSCACIRLRRNRPSSG